MIYFISDFHFGHSNILKFERFNFKSIEEHDDYIMSMLEKSLHENDVLYHLGDFGYPSEDIVSRWNKLKCKKIGIAGNHDLPKYKYEKLFDEYYTHPVYISSRIVLSHEPIKCNSDCINVHGHLHASDLYIYNYLCVSIYVTNYKLVSLKSVMKKLSNIKKESNVYTEEWYAPFVKYCKERLNVNKCVFPRFDKLKNVEISIDGDRFVFSEKDIVDYSVGNVYKFDKDLYFTNYFFLTIPNVFNDINLEYAHFVIRFTIVDIDGKTHEIYNDCVTASKNIKLDKDFVKITYLA